MRNRSVKKSASEARNVSIRKLTLNLERSELRKFVEIELSDQREIEIKILLGHFVAFQIMNRE